MTGWERMGIGGLSQGFIVLLGALRGRSLVLPGTSRLFSVILMR
jgi:hypothetical protein